MKNLKRPEGLIRIDSHFNLSQQEKSSDRPDAGFRLRPVLYGVLLLFLTIAFSYQLFEKKEVAIKFARQEGVAYSQFPDGRFANIFKIRFSNNTNHEQNIQFQSMTPGFELICGACGSEIEPLGKRDIALIVVKKLDADSDSDVQKAKVKFLVTNEMLELPFLSASPTVD